MESLSKAIAESTLTEDQVQMTIPSKKFKEWSASFKKFKSALKMNTTQLRRKTQETD